MVNLEEDYDDQLRVLQAGYVSRLPSKIQQIDKVYLSFKANPEKTEELKNLRLLSHRLAGSGATYGFDSVSNCARAIELYLDGFLEKDLNLTESQHLHLENLIGNLKKSF